MNINVNENLGNRNTGDSNAGHLNAGNFNAGNCNTGNWNTCDRETGYFNSVSPRTVNIFNKPCDIEVWRKAVKPKFLFFSPTEYEDGVLTSKLYKEAFQDSYNSLDPQEKMKQAEQLKALPNFDASVFYEISGIKIEG